MRNAEIVGGPITDPWGKYGYDDPILAPGSLFLFDPTHSQGEFAGKPTDNQALPNIAWPLAAEALGGGDEASLAAVCSIDAITGSVVENTHYKLERTSKGGIHFLPTQAGPLSNGGPHLTIAPPAAVISELLANPEDHYYFSAWMVQTRPCGGGVAAPQPPLLAANSTGAYFFRNENGSFFTVTGPPFLGSNGAIGFTNSSALTGVPSLLSVGTQGFRGTVPGSLALAAVLGAFGYRAGENDDAPYGGILYRMYIEKMSLHGRTYAETRAIDLALFNAAFGDSGKLADDVYLDPATFA